MILDVELKCNIEVKPRSFMRYEVMRYCAVFFTTVKTWTLFWVANAGLKFYF